MVSNHTNPRSEGFFLNPTATIALPGLSPMASVPAPDPIAEDALKRVRKPYTITKSRESWTEPEHDKFLEALQLFDRDWKKIEAFIATKTAKQIRSHAQKYFIKVEKSGKKEHLPPPRPKKKAARPYPQKASKTASTPAQRISFQSSAAWLQPAYTLIPDSSSMLQTSMTNERPDFSRVYNFIGSVFDPNVTSHLQRLKMMTPLEVKTVLQLMTNLSVNLFSPEFEDDRKVLSTYYIDSDISHQGDKIKIRQRDKPYNAV